MLFGGAGNDVISGGGGDDDIFGGDGADALDGGDGINNIDGGPGANVPLSDSGIRYADEGDPVNVGFYLLEIPESIVVN